MKGSIVELNKELTGKAVKSSTSQASHPSETLTYQDRMTKLQYWEGAEEPA
jgi:hypothetical protein